MRVFVWKNYGIISVFKAESVEDIQSVWSKFVDSLEFLDKELADKLTYLVAKHFDGTADTYIKAMAVALAEWGGQHECFESGTGFAKLQ